MIISFQLIQLEINKDYLDFDKNSDMNVETRN